MCTLQVTAQAAGDALPSKKVSYADLDISQPAGAKVLYVRIVKAANEVCRSTWFSSFGAVQTVTQCIDNAIDNAVKAVGSPALSALRPNSAIRFASK